MKGFLYWRWRSAFLTGARRKKPERTDNFSTRRYPFWQNRKQTAKRRFSATTTTFFGRCVMPWFVGEKNESVVLLSLDNRYRLINATRVFSGSVNSTQFSCRIAVQQALRDNATQVVLAHNHPNGHAFYSDADVETTRRFRQATEMLGIRLLDHLIVSDGDFISLRDTPQTAGLFSNDRGRVSVVQNDGEVTDKVADREP